MMRPSVPWPAEVLDSYDHAMCVIDAENDVVYANRLARELLELDGDGTPARVRHPAVDVARSVRAEGAPRREVVVETGAGRSWRGQAWLMLGGAVAFAVQPVYERDDVHALQSALELSEREARLALRIASGMSNRDIAAEDGIPVGTVATRAWRLYRKLDISNRAELATLVTLKLGKAARG